MKNKITVAMPQGAMGAYEEEPEIESLLRRIAARYNTNPTNWPDKYGIDFENGDFMMHSYCWCEKDGCPWCEETFPNFRHKATGFEVRWYKYIGRSMEYNMNPPIEALKELLKEGL